MGVLKSINYEKLLPRPSFSMSLKRRSHKEDLLQGTAFETRAIHMGLDYRGTTGAVIPPLFMTSTFEAENPEGFDYTRSGNPTFTNLENTLASLEGARFASVFSSGVAAITAVVSSLKSGDLVLAEENIYGCTYRMFDKVFQKFGVAIEYLDFSAPDNYLQILAWKPKLVWIESPTNPLLKIIDIAAVSEFTRKAGSSLVVDNTFASSFFQRPLELGADLSLLSTTKYVNGHSDCLGGAVCTNKEQWQDKMCFTQKALGLNPSPFDAWLISRGVKTMALRMARHEQNAIQVAQYLEQSGRANFVRYPFLPSHPQYELAQRQMSGGSGIVTADLRLPLSDIKAFLKRLKLFTTAESLGGIESLICHPATMTHASIPKEQREKVGITDSLLRLSVGIENGEDLIADLEQALRN